MGITKLFKELGPKVVSILKIRRTKAGREKVKLRLKKLLKNSRLIKTE